jgi:SAM-dependent methyltransferase
METRKAYDRRLKEGYFHKYCQGSGIDIGAGPDPIILPPDVRGTVKLFDQDFGDGDATLMNGIQDNSFDWVHSSHCLEHLMFPTDGLVSWWRILKPGGFLLINVPHRDLYEKRRTLPSRWNGDHKAFWLLDKNDPPCTFGLVPLVKQTLPQAELVYARVVDSNRVETPPDQHSVGEYSIEGVWRKRN